MLVAPLHEVSADNLVSVLKEEVQCWDEQLFWDYSTASSLIRRYLDMHSLPGHALRTEEGDIVGYSYHVQDREIGYIGCLFVEKRFASREAYLLLLAETLKALRSNGTVKRIESQIFPFNFDPKGLFQSHGFQAIERHFLIRHLQRARPPDRRKHSVGLIPWTPAYLNQAAEVIYDSYRNSVDYALCYDYQSLRGCLRFLNNLIHSPGCGQFSTAGSLLAVDSEGHVLGVLLTSVISPQTGMIPQVSVKRSAQGKGLGSSLLNAYFQKASELGLQRVALSVSDANQGAFRLYRRLGFERCKPFHAFVWNQG